MFTEAGREEELRYRALLAVELSAPEALEALAAGLHDESWRVRKAAIEQLLRLPAPAAGVPRLIGILAERGEPGARNAAVEALARLGEPAVPPLVELLRHPEPDQRKLAADTLGMIGSRQAEEPLVAAVEDPDLNVCVSAAEALARIDGEVSGRALERALKRPEELLRLAALEGLVQLRRPPAMPEVVPLLSDRRLRRSAWRALGLIRQPAALDLICKGLQSEDRAAREAALAALGLQWLTADAARRGELEATLRAECRAGASLQPVVLTSLLGEDLELKAGALLAAAMLRDAELVVLVAEAATDDRLAREVTWALLKMGPQAGRTLLSQLGTLSAGARAAATEALVELVEPSWVEPLVALAGSGDPELQLFALRALGRSQSAAAVAPLLAFLGEPELAFAASRALVMLSGTFHGHVLAGLEELMASAPSAAGVIALARVGRRSALPALRRALRDPEPTVRTAAAEAAWEVGGDDCLELARLALADEVPAVRVAGARVLGKLASPVASPLLRLALGDDDEGVQAAAIQAVGECGVAELSPELERLVHQSDGLRAGRAMRALGRLGKVTPGALRAAAHHVDPEVSKEALSCGAAMPEGVTLALELLSHPRWDVRAAAARVLGASGDAGCLPPVREAFWAERDPVAREALAEASARLAER